jgi:hypothetical protein
LIPPLPQHAAGSASDLNTMSAPNTSKKAAKAARTPTKRTAKPSPHQKGKAAKNGNQHAIVLRPRKPSPKPRMVYSPEIGLKICERIALREPLRKICAEPDMPCEREVYYWKLEHADFMHNYARAREHRAESRADQIDDYIEMVRTGQLDANSARVMIDAEKWQASKELPKRYGDRVELDAKAALMVVETPAAVKALLEALPDLGVLPLKGSAALEAPVADISERDREGQ